VSAGFIHPEEFAVRASDEDRDAALSWFETAQACHRAALRADPGGRIFNRKPAAGDEVAEVMG
jgi:hypothetical protein